MPTPTTSSATTNSARAERRGPDVSLLRLLDPDRITAMDRASTLDFRVDAHAGLVVLGRGAQDAGIPRQVPLGEGRHHTAATGAGNFQANGIADGEREANPSILDEVFFSGGRRYHDIGTKPRDLETPLRIE